MEAMREALDNATSLWIGAGAGMSVDSGLPDFRGPQGFWRAYPPYAAQGLSFSDLANPRWFRDDPHFAWGFYGHRLHLYRDTVPHEGFRILLRWAQNRDHFVFTSNVDGAFQRAGFREDVIEECHGSIHHLQCIEPCHDDIWHSDESVEVDAETFRAHGDLPRCPRCGGLARPAILMFGDAAWSPQRTARQHTRYLDFLERIDPLRTVAIECGAGTAIPSVRWQAESLQARGATLVRINPRESEGPPGTISLASGALQALAAL